jgi:hypothetical protein
MGVDRQREFHFSKLLYFYVTVNAFYLIGNDAISREKFNNRLGDPT